MAAVLRRFVLIALIAATPAGPAAAHAFLTATVPEDGVALDAAPSVLSLRFNEPVTPVKLGLRDGDGRPAAPADAWTAAGDTLTLPLPAPLPTGVYAVDYRVTGADGHPVAGTLTFGVGARPPATAEKDGGALSTAAVAALAVRWLHYASLIAGFGGGLFVLLVCPRGAPLPAGLRPGLAVPMALAAVTGAVLVGLNGAVLDGGTPADLASARVWTIGAAAGGGAAPFAVAAALLGLAGLARTGADRRGGALLAAAALLAALSLAATGHAGTSPPRWLSVPLVVVHGLAAMLWVGALGPLALVLTREDAARALPLVRRFSALAVLAVAVLLAAGTGLSALQGVSAHAVAASGYGQLWLGKVLLAAAMLGIAAWNRGVATPRLTTGTTASLRRGVVAEAALAGALLALTAAFALTPPPRSLHGIAPPPVERVAGYSAITMTGGLTAVLEVTPATAGRNHVRLLLADDAGRPAAATVAAAEWSAPDRAPIAMPIATGTGAASGDVDLPDAGGWTVRFTLGEPPGRSIVLNVPITSRSPQSTPTKPKGSTP